MIRKLKIQKRTYGTNNRFTSIVEGPIPLAKLRFTCVLDLGVLVVVKKANELIKMAFVNWTPW